jgi:hypothetical protein
VGGALGEVVFVHPDLVADQVQALGELANPAGHVLQVLAASGADPAPWLRYQ